MARGQGVETPVRYFEKLAPDVGGITLKVD